MIIFNQLVNNYINIITKKLVLRNYDHFNSNIFFKTLFCIQEFLFLPRENKKH